MRMTTTGKNNDRHSHRPLCSAEPGRPKNLRVAQARTTPPLGSPLRRQQSFKNFKLYCQPPTIRRALEEIFKSNKQRETRWFFFLDWGRVPRTQVWQTTLRWRSSHTNAQTNSHSHQAILEQPTDPQPNSSLQHIFPQLTKIHVARPVSQVQWSLLHSNIRTCAPCTHTPSVHTCALRQCTSHTPMQEDMLSLSLSVSLSHTHTETHTHHK